MAQAIGERDAYSSAAEEHSQKLEKSIRENKILEQQLNDLGRQIQTLLKEVGRIQDPSIPSDQELEEDPSTQPAENIEAVITNNLVLFRSIPALQDQNQKLLKVVREMGAKMEAEEKDYREALQIEQTEAVQEAHKAIEALQEQLRVERKQNETTIQTLTKERDVAKGTLAKERAMTFRSGAVNGHSTSLVDGAIDGSQELSDVQSQFEAYKVEMNVDSVTLREEVLTSQREASQLGATLAKANAKIEYLNGKVILRVLSSESTQGFVRSEPYASGSS